MEYRAAKERLTHLSRSIIICQQYSLTFFSSVKNVEIHLLGSQQLCSLNITRIPACQWCEIKILSHSVLIPMRNFPDPRTKNIPDILKTRPGMRKALGLICINPNYKHPNHEDNLGKQSFSISRWSGHQGKEVRRNDKIISPQN